MTISISCSAIVNPAKCEMIVKQGDASISNGTGYFNFGNIPLHFSQLITFTIVNTGIDDLLLTNTPLIECIGDDASDFVASTNFTKKRISPDSSTSFSINFFPKSLGKKTATIVIPNTDRNNNPYTFVITGNCTSPAPEIHVKQGSTDIICSTGTYNFGSVKINSTSDPVAFTIENNGNEVLELTGSPYKIMVTGTDASMFPVDQINTYPTISAGNSTTFSITFEPTTSGIKTAKVSILNTDSDENPYTFNIFGTGFGAPEINLKHDTVDIANDTWLFDFSEVLINETSQELRITIENVGTSPLQLTNAPDLIVVSGTDAAMFTVNKTDTKDHLGPGESTTFGIFFAPTSAGQKNATVTIENNDDDENPYTFAVKGTCTEPEINVKRNSANIPNSTGSHNFGLIALGKSSPEITFTIENLGTGDLKLTGSPKIATTGTDSAMFAINQTSTNPIVSMGALTTFTVTFTPTSTGNKTATISIANNDVDENPYTFSLLGECQMLYPEIDVYQDDLHLPSGTSTFNIGGTKLNVATPNYRFFIKNTGDNDLVLTGSPEVIISGADASMFSVNLSYITTPILKTKHTFFYLNFTPTSIGVKNATMTIPNNDSDENPYIIYLTGWGHDLTNGDADGWIGGGSDGWKTGIAPSSSQTDFRSFSRASACSFDGWGNIYVCDTDNHRICKWSRDGKALGWIGGGSDGWKTTAAPTSGASDARSFRFPRGLHVNEDGDIFVADTDNNRICRWYVDGTCGGWIGGGNTHWSFSSGAMAYRSLDAFDKPTGVFEYVSDLYIADTGNHRISWWDIKDGEGVAWFGGGTDGWKTTSGTNAGNDFRSFNSPVDIHINAGKIFIADSVNNVITKWEHNGAKALGWIGHGSNGWKTSVIPSTSGTDYQSFNQVSGVCTDSSGNIYTADTGNNRVCKWNGSGTAIGWIGEGSDGWKTTTAPGSSNIYRSFNQPFRVAIDANGYLYVADLNNFRISRWYSN